MWPQPIFYLLVWNVYLSSKLDYVLLANVPLCILFPYFVNIFPLSLLTFPNHQQCFPCSCSYNTFSCAHHRPYFRVLVNTCDLQHKLESFILWSSLWVDNRPLLPVILCQEVWRSHIPVSLCDGRRDTLSFLELKSIFSHKRQETGREKLLEQPGYWREQKWTWEVLPGDMKNSLVKPV